jgi:H/ACA ribonucleoprotein complex subunit 3
MARPHSQLSDWYAYNTMLFQSLVYLNPYFGGVHKPPKGQKQLRDTARVLHRVSVFSPDVRIPKDALPLENLPDELCDHFKAVYDSDARGVFPLALLRTLRWTTCTTCGSAHSRNVCPSCMAPGAVTQKVVVTGNVTATRLFQTHGTILFATYQGGELRYVYHESGTYRREGGAVILTGDLDRQLRVRIWRGATVFAKGTSLVALHPDGQRDRYTTGLVGRLSIFAANESHLYWLEDNRLVHDARLGVVGIGDVLPNQTLVWAGKTFGFGFYRAGTLTRGFVFDAERPGLNDSVPLSPMRGNLIDATCTFSDNLAWFMLEVEDGGVIRHYCHVINDRGELLSSTEASPGDDTWLSHGIRGHYARGNHLFVATDAGIVRVTFDAGLVGVSREYPATERFVSTGAQLLPASGGIAVVSTREITLLQIK